jgi:predicted outer membrane repeat protein
MITVSSRANGDSVVKACATDDTHVKGAIDLKTAIGLGGRISFSCPAGSVITITAIRDIVTSTTIDGGGLITLDAGGTVPMFSMSNSGTVLTLKGVTLRRGRSNPNPFPKPNPGGNGGIVSGRGMVEIVNSTIRDTSNAIWMVAGAVRVSDSEFADGAGTAIFAPTIELVRARVHGAAIHPVVSTGGTVSIADSQFIGSGSSTFDKCQLSIARSKFSGSSSTAVVSGCSTTISGGEFSNNHGQNGGALLVTKNAAGLQINGVKFTGNDAELAGGAIAFEAVTGAKRNISFADVVFDSNRAADGGAISLGTAIENDLSLLGRALIFSNNQAKTSGGAIAGTNAQIALTRVLFNGNAAGNRGGAISLMTYAQRPSVIASSIFNSNSSPNGSALFGSTVKFLNVTIANSQRGPALATFWPAPAPWRIITFRNVVFVANAAPVCDARGGNNLNNPLFQDAGNNVQFPAAGCLASIPVADPKLDAMFIPAPDGAASGKGDLATCVASPVNGVDLFGRHRPQGKSCSIGAVEGDIVDAVINSNPQYGNPPKLPPNPNCQCASTTPSTSTTSPPSPSIATVAPLTPPPSLTPPQTTTPSTSVPPDSSTPSSQPPSTTPPGSR